MPGIDNERLLSPWFIVAVVVNMRFRGNRDPGEVWASFMGQVATRLGKGGTSRSVKYAAFDTFVLHYCKSLHFGVPFLLCYLLIASLLVSVHFCSTVIFSFEITSMFLRKPPRLTLPDTRVITRISANKTGNGCNTKGYGTSARFNARVVGMEKANSTSAQFQSILKQFSLLLVERFGNGLTMIYVSCRCNRMFLGRRCEINGLGE